ncbi:hypothetical protein GOBAR_AA25809 [Gossypium barbadense]|uniref:Uncharacterized protein n=1 Tax=Gossypium barbadense TaxID=3634 RepID=A0A2P5WUT8_GOSBA|nr:hypothetical protein GOBAR_AA25809 [Gossypium barbadense]
MGDISGRCTPHSTVGSRQCKCVVHQRVVLNFLTVEWYNADRVMLQFGCIQYVLDIPQRFDVVYEHDLEPQPPSPHISPVAASSHPELQVDTFGKGSQSYAYHLDMVDCSLNYQQSQSSMMVDIFRLVPLYSMYSTPPKRSFNLTYDFSDILNIPQGSCRTGIMTNTGWGRRKWTVTNNHAVDGGHRNDTTTGSRQF